jgi:hypothetical protein
MTLERIGAILRINAFIQSKQGKLYLDDKEILCVSLDNVCSFARHTPDIELTHEQITDLFNRTSSVKTDIVTLHLPVVSTRDTQFAGFAELLAQELIMEAQRPDRSELLLLLARRAYDLVKHTLLTTDYPDRFNLTAAMQEIPDMTAWPEVNE